MLLGMSCLNSCANQNYEIDYPVFPIAGPNVAKELEKIDPQELNYTWEWIGRLNKLRLELDVLKSP